MALNAAVKAGGFDIQLAVLRMPVLQVGAQSTFEIEITRQWNKLAATAIADTRKSLTNFLCKSRHNFFNNLAHYPAGGSQHFGIHQMFGVQNGA